MLKRALLCTGAVLLAASMGFAAPKVAASKIKSFTGYVTDSKCAKLRTNEACVKKCVAGGATLVLYDTYTHKVYHLDPQSAVTAHAGHHVRVYGTMAGDTITVSSVKMLAMAKPKSKMKM